MNAHVKTEEPVLDADEECSDAIGFIKEVVEGILKEVFLLQLAITGASRFKIISPCLMGESIENQSVVITNRLVELHKSLKLASEKKGRRERLAALGWNED
jgi:hypothetical protein